MYKRVRISILISLLTMTAGQSYASTTVPFTIIDASISSVHTAIKNNALTCVELVKLYLDRINHYNFTTSHNKAPLNAITTISPSVFEDARALDEYYKTHQQLIGSLHCVPIIVKDNIDTYDSPSTSGSFSLLGNQPINDAYLVQKLRKAGAIIIAKGSMDEFANGLSGLSSRNGRTGNAYDPNQNPGGSSSGVAVAVSADFALAGIGTDNSCSVRIPAAFNGLVGLRPSMGLISQNGIFPRGNMDGVAGPIAKTTTDLAKILTVIATPDPADVKTQVQPSHDSYVKDLVIAGLRNKRIGIVRSVKNVDVRPTNPEAINKFNAALAKMQALGAVMVNNIDLPEFNTNRKLNEAGEREDINTYLASHPATRKNYTDICESNRTRTFGKSVAECLKFVKNLPSKQNAYTKGQAIFARNEQYINKIMAKNHLDALLMITNVNGSATYEHSTYKPSLIISSNAGIPSITFPIGYDQRGMPIGIELIAQKYQERKLLQMAYDYEQANGHRKLPELPPAELLLEPFNIYRFNNFINLLGQKSYDEIIKNSKGKDLNKTLTPSIFRKLVIQCKQNL